MRRAALPAITLAVLLAPTFAAAPARGEDAGPIEDNSFLVEEAYNQEPRIVQHIFTWMRPRGGGAWEASFTQEWPFRSRKHQLSYTIPVQQIDDGAGGTRGIGDIALNYRYMWLGAEGGRVAFAPRLSALLPTGDFDRGLGAAAAGVQVNLPLSVTLGQRWVMHSNAGVTWIGKENAEIPYTSPVPFQAPPPPAPATRGVHLGQSAIWLAHPRMNLMLELAWERTESDGVPGDADLEESLLLSPGLRWALDFANGLQIVPGVAVPIGLGPSSGDSVFLYLSFEHGF